MVSTKSDLDVFVHQELLPSVQIRASHISDTSAKCRLEVERPRTDQWLVPIPDASSEAVAEVSLDHLL